MRKFSKLFVPGKTWVVVYGASEYRLVKHVHETRQWIQLEGYEGNYKRGHVKHYTNKVPAHTSRAN